MNANQDFIASARIATAKGEVELTVTQTSGTDVFNFWVQEPKDRKRCVSSGNKNLGAHDAETLAHIANLEAGPVWWGFYARALYAMLFTSQQS